METKIPRALQCLSWEGFQLLKKGLPGLSRADPSLRILSPELGPQGQPGLTSIFWPSHQSGWGNKTSPWLQVRPPTLCSNMKRFKEKQCLEDLD